MFGLDPSSLSLQYTSQIHTFSSWSGSQGHSSPLYFTPFASGGIIFLFTPPLNTIAPLYMKKKHYTLTDQIIPLFNKTTEYKLWSWFSLACLLLTFILWLSGLFTKVLILKRGPYNIFFFTLWSYLGIPFTFRCNSLVSRGIWSSL